jgi:hypothetical protein
MKTIVASTRVAVATSLITALLFTSCSKPNLDISGWDPFRMPTVNLVSYKVNLHKINTYPANSKIQLRAYLSSENIRYNKSVTNEYETNAANTTKSYSDGYAGLYYYIAWKVTSNTDSLNGGKTPAVVMANNTTFDVNY